MDHRVIATLPVVKSVNLRLQESAPGADSSDPRFEGMTDLERARLIAALNNALGKLEECEKVHGVLATPQDKTASLLQSLIVEHRTGADALPNGQTLEARFDASDWLGWLSTFWEILKHADKFPWKAAPAGAQRVPQFDSHAPRVAVFSDWATGLYGAPLIRDSIVADKGPVDAVLHLGDIYYSGRTDEVAARFSAMWPTRPGALNRGLNGNHEMYCGGQPYIDAVARPPFGQTCSHFAYANDHWIIVGLDTAYDDHDLAAPQADWLSAIVAGADGRRVVLFSHHQPFSLLSGQGPKLVERLRPLLEGGRIFAWYWGHEHQCVLYDKHPGWNMYGRCVGHGGMPEFRPAALGPAVRTRQFRRFAGTSDAPAGLVLDGPNPYIKGEEKKFTPHGYAMLRFEPDRLVETVHDADGTPLVTNELR